MLAALEAARAAASGVERVATGLATARDLRVHRASTLGDTRRASDLIGRTTAAVDNTVALLNAAGETAPETSWLRPDLEGLCGPVRSR